MLNLFLFKLNQSWTIKNIDLSKAPHTNYTLDPLFKYLFETKPKLVSQTATTNQPTKCQAISCTDDILSESSLIASYLVKFNGATYNSDTLMPVNDLNVNSDSPLVNAQMEKDGLNKEFFICPRTMQFAQLCHSVRHLKMHFYEICQNKVNLIKYKYIMTKNYDAF